MKKKCLATELYFWPHTTHAQPPPPLHIHNLSPDCQYRMGKVSREKLQGTCVAIFLWRHPEITGNYEYCIYRITVPGNFAHDCCFGEDS